VIRGREEVHREEGYTGVDGRKTGERIKVKINSNTNCRS